MTPAPAGAGERSVSGAQRRESSACCRDPFRVAAGAGLAYHSSLTNFSGRLAVTHPHANSNMTSHPGLRLRESGVEAGVGALSGIEAPGPN